MDLLTLSFQALQRGAFGWIVVAALLTAFELTNPRAPTTLRDRASGLAFWALSIPLSALLVTLMSMTMDALGIEPLIELPISAATAWMGPLSAIIAVLLAAIVHDFFFYWFHRIQHRFLWRFHAVHHSIRDLSAVNSYHHATEALMSLVLLTIPTTLIVADAGSALPYVNLALWLHIVWIHSPTRITFGPLRALLVDNRFHRIHHSLQPEHFDHNFGAFTTIWDRLFGTAWFPRPDEWPDVGLAEVDQPRTVGEWLDLPDRYRDAVAAKSLSQPSLGDGLRLPS
ncbi:sterol desaturase family protein [Sphingomonas sp. Y38-1Y]|uniref:sterol desaturase family protein n=1 Tax=Sphingomonas sp. Y38-1Y TaxID=3078265 RepID=UPI0028E7C439|nr:sterol desaturase family protein [Sphingomonas sp. Y38-1Y]